ncbi:MAG TPA: cytochrome c3 family protein [Pyrinomonadaceae bacterium]
MTHHRQANGCFPGGARVRPRMAVRQWAALVIVLLAAVVFLLTLIAGRSLYAMTPEPQPAAGVPQDYASFNHRSASHSSLQCASCHPRSADNAARPQLPGHKSCTVCHLSQFVTPQIPMCSICHVDVSGPSAPVRAFPERFKESFNVRFDHAQHMNGPARPRQGCAACHDRPLARGAALSIPAGLSAHDQCYACHTPGSQSSLGSDIGSCNTCHAPAPYARTSTTARAFRAGFSHARHGPLQRLACADCHSLTAGLPQSRQVSVPRTAQHIPAGRSLSCMTCHDGRRAFGDELSFKDCRRCHKGQTFRVPL